MSYLTGKCDFYDHVYMIGNPKEFLETATIYYGDARVDIKEEKDLFPYATHLIASAFCSKEKQTIHLSKQSYIDTEEIESVAWRVRDCISLARKAKKEKVAFTYEWIKDKITDFRVEEAPWRQIVDIINKNPDLIKFHIPKEYRENRRILEGFIVPEYFSEVHLATYNSYRERFVEEASKKGFMSYKNEGGKMITVDGEFHPVIWDMCWKINSYKTNREKYKC